MTAQETDRYDIATMKALAANLAAFYHGLVENGLTEEQAMDAMLAYLEAIATPRAT